MDLDFTEFPVIDAHCHPFIPDRETESFEQYLTLSMIQIPKEDMRSTLLYKMVIAKLRSVLCMPTIYSDDEVIKCRTDLYKANRALYIGRLLSAANIDTLLVDIGFPSDEVSGYEIDLDWFRTLLGGLKTRTIVRMEPIVFRLLGLSLTFNEVESTFRSDLENDIKRHRAVAVKSSIAYETGLGVDLVTREDANRAFARLQSDSRNKRAEKMVRDYLFLIGLDVCIEHSLPVQLHTGIGDAPLLDLPLGNPLLLFPLLKHDRYGRATFVFVHAAYPFLAEAGFLANQYPGVWIDLSEMVPFVGSGVERSLRTLCEMCPLSKLVYGSDGYNIPELFWFSAVYFRECMSRVLRSLIEEGCIDAEFARQAGENILAGNARRLYRLNN